jgi:hypothetical protein
MVGYGDLIVFQESLLHQISISSSKMKRYYTIISHAHII